ncbi:MAG: hypothetical protein PUG64_01985 [Bacteroidales bacterium]|nr:hypothetical protein [Bacteroidales bacterium]MDY3912406.1 hypothetical protein [Sodaliphilus sp.]
MSQLLSILLLSLLDAGQTTVSLTFEGDAMQHAPQIKAAAQCGQ